MELAKTYRPQSWSQKESISTGLADAPEVYHDNQGLQPVYRDYKVGHANNALEVPQPRPRTRANKHRGLWLLSAVAIILVLLALGLGIGLHFRSIASSASTTSPQPVTVTASIVSIIMVSTTPSSLSTSSTSSPSTSTTITTTSTTVPATSGSTGIAANDCATRGSDKYTTNNYPTTFSFDCGADYPHNEATYSGNGTIQDLLPLVAYTFEQCMETCAIYNTQSSITTKCAAITYAANLTDSIAKRGANCWLKSARGQLYYGSAIEIPSSAYIDLG